MPSAATKVLALFEYPSLNGGENSLLCLAPALRQRGYELVAASPEAGPLIEQLDALNIARRSWEVQSGGARRPLEEIRRDLAALIAEERPALVHANSLSTARIAGPVAQRLHQPSVGHLRDIVGVSRRVVDDLHCHSRLLAVSNATRDWHVERGMDERRVFVVHNGVDLNRFAPRPADPALLDELGLPADARLITSIGQLGMRKGLDVLLDAARVFLPPYPDVRVLVIGERHSSKDEAICFEEELRNRADEPLLGGRVHLPGRREDIPRILNATTALVHAARQEPLGRVLLEAAASGTPVIATRVGGTEEIFADAASALLVPPNDPLALANAVQRCLADADLGRQLAAAARARAEHFFSLNRAADALAEHYREAISAR